MNCFKGHSLVKEFYDLGSTGGTVSTLAFCILEMDLAKGIVCLNQEGSNPLWFLAHNKTDLLKAAGSTYEYIKFDYPWAPNLAQIGKPCDLRINFSPRISLFCSHSYRRKKEPISKDYAGLKKSKLKTVFENPVRCFLCPDHLGFSADISVGDLQDDPKTNVLLVHSEVGEQLLDFAVNHKYANVENIEVKVLQQKQPYLWRKLK